MEKDTIVKSIETFLNKTKNPLLVLLGPTASGKTALSLKLAKKFNGEIISADSRQVYKHMDIGTDKIPLEKREGIPHFLLDVVDPDDRFTVADFKQLAEEKIDDIIARGKLPMLVGGTGLYIRAITENFAFPEHDAKIRNELYAELESMEAPLGTSIARKKMHEKLTKLDPKSAEKIHFNNLPYVMRALEIVLSTGLAKTDQKNPKKYASLKIGLAWPREILNKRIDARVDNQIQNGLIEETQELQNLGYSSTLASMRSLGYREMAQYLSGGLLKKEDAINLLKKNTRHFAKRQMTWFNAEKDIVWINEEAAP